MKIEIDFSRPDELRKTKRELEMALRTIESALVAISANEPVLGQPLLPSSQSSSEVAATSNDFIAKSGLKISLLISSLPNEFTMRDVLGHPEASMIPNSRIRREMAELVKAGYLNEIEKGQGRRPSRFRKA